MKHNVFKGLLAGSLAVSLAACDVNSWNDHELPGFEEPGVTIPAKSIEYTLTDADYEAVAAQGSNIIMYAKQEGISYKDAEKALLKLGSRGYFGPDFPADKYLPAFLDSIKFPYFALANGSSLSLTYRESETTPAEVTGINGAAAMTVSAKQYMDDVWGGTLYTTAFTPAKKASSYLPGLLKNEYPDAEAGSYALVTYNEASTEPDFGEVETPTDVDKVKADGAVVTVSGTVTGICNQGFELTDATGSLLVYYGSSFKDNSVEIGQIVLVKGKGAAYNGGLQLGSPEAPVVLGAETVSLTARKLTGAEMDAIAADFIAGGRNTGHMGVYTEFSGVSTVDGNYVNIILDGVAAGVKGSAYQATQTLRDMVKSGEVNSYKGWFMSASKTFYNFIITEVNGKPVYANAPEQPYMPSPTPVESEVRYATYTFNGTAWKEAASDVYTMQPSDYAAMGLSNNVMSSEAAAHNVPVLLKMQYPYAAEGDVRFVVWRSSSKDNPPACREFVYDGSAWTLDEDVTEVTSPYARVNDSWIFDPNVNLSLPRYSNGATTDPAYSFYLTAVNWVKSNIGASYIDKYGTSEYYSGCSAYYFNVNNNSAQVRKTCPAPWENVSDEEMIAQMREHFLYEVMPATLKEFYPNAKLIDGYDKPIIYQISYVTYDDDKKDVKDTVRYQVTGPSEFKLVYSTWLGGKVTEE